MAKYRKKPVVIEAMQWDGSEASGTGIAVWANSRMSNYVLYQPAGKTLNPETSEPVTHEEVFTIATLEGWMTVSKGDFIIQGVQGEFYPCKPDIFEATYEAVDE